MFNSHMSQKKKILFAVHTETSFRELFRIAKFLKKTDIFQPVFYFYDQNHSLERMQSECANAGITYFSLGFRKMDASHDNKNVGSKQKRQSLTMKIKKLIVKTLPVFIFEILMAVNFFIVQLSLNRNNRKVLFVFTPILVVVPEDGLGGNLDLILLARSRGIPVIDIPYEYSTKKQIVEAIKSNPKYKKLFGIYNPFNRLVGFLFPRWVYTYLGETLLRERPSIILSLEAFCLAPRDPWTVHGGFADYIAVESRKMYIHYLNEGIPQNKLILTGTMADDQLFETITKKETLRSDLCKSHGLKRGDKLIVSSLPTDYTFRSGCEFKNYKALIDFWIGNLNRLKDTAVIIQLHPAVTPEQEAYIRSKKLVISESNIANLIPLCDVFVTSVSSVIRMAITCKVPVVNYDVFNFGYMDYEDATGVITLSSKEDFKSILVELVSNKEVYDSITARHSHYAAEWGILDGKSGERILKLFSETISGKIRSK